MENFIVSARKYRPVTFDTVVGQKSITSTLKNAIKNNHLAQAFLFCGPRGVGKTTCARILAKTINCENLSPNMEACNVCKPCQSFNTSNSFNVFELDAASNNSVDDIRNLVDQVRVPPQIGQYKIYIIDEVHMLSASAFNAFLKTLEEPPAYAKFILATTEKHKIIPTILSRCQIFDFNRITIDDIAKHLAFVATSEHVVAEPDALQIIAQKADGALRDALSIFDQIVSFAGDDGVTYKAVIENLNVLDYDYFFNVTSNILHGNIPATLLVLNEILEHGFDGHHFVNGLGEHYRSLLVCKDASTVKLLEVGESIRDKYIEQAKVCTPDFLLKALDLLAKCDVNYKTSSNKRLLIELTLMQMCSLSSQHNPFKEVPKTETIKPIVKPASTEVKPVIAEPVKKVEELKVEEIKKVEDNSEKVKTEEKTPDIVAEPPVKNVTKKFVHATKSILETLAENDKKNGTAENGKVEEAASDYEKPEKEFTQEAFDKAWLSYAEQFKQDSPDLYITLTSRMPELKDDFIIELSIENVVQEKEISDRKLDMLTFLRTELSNFKLQLQTVVNKNPDNVKPFTPQEKFKKMAEKNPAIKKLKDKFDLEIDF
jgi:DNA polymerase-3 subunit gamma/tau